MTGMKKQQAGLNELNLNINHFNKELTMFLRGKPRIINVLQKPFYVIEVYG